MEPRILIVGAGPVGLIVAAELAKYGVAHDIIEAEPTKNSYSKALSVSAASLKAFRGLGVADEFEKTGKIIHDIEIYFKKRRCARINKKFLPTCYNFYLSMPQPDTEAILERKLEALGGAVIYGVRLVELTQDDSGVDVRLVRDASDDSWSARYDYVLGCDGAQSATRNLLNIEYEGHDYNAHFVMGDVTFDAPRAATTSYHVFDDGFLIYLPMSRGLTRLVVGRHQPLTVGQPNPTQEELQTLLDRYYPHKLFIESLVWASRTRFFNRLARTNAIGRVLLAGDAFHLFSPIGGQGMNTGVQDAINLAWKVALTIKGLAKPALLESYREERYAAVQKVLQSTHDNTLRILRRAHGDEFLKNYKVCFGNRDAYRALLPAEFSGFACDHAEEADSLVGRHAPYFEIEGDDEVLRTTYDVPQSKRAVAILSPGVDEAAIQQMAQRYEHVLSIARKREKRPFEELEDTVPSDEICVVRPDGYVGFQGRTVDLRAYLDRYFM